MNFLIALFDGIALILRRNPITFFIIVLLAIVAPSFLKGVAVVALYMIMGLVVLVVAVALLFRWKIRKLQKRAAENFRQSGFNGQNGFGGEGGFSGEESQPIESEEGDVKVYKTTASPQKRVSSEVGDYVDFEETKE